MLPGFFNMTITRLRAGQKDSRGSTVPDWTNPESLSISGCSVQPSNSDLSLDGRVLGIKDVYRVYCPIGSDILAGDRIVYDGQTFTVDEAPRKWISPTGRLNNLQFNMALWKG